MSSDRRHKTRGQLIDELEALRASLSAEGAPPASGPAVPDEILVSENKYRVLIDNLKDVVFTFDPQGRISFASRVVEEVLGFKPSDLVNTNLLDYVIEEDKAKSVLALSQGMQGEKIAQFEARARSKSGAMVVLEVSCSRLWEKGRATGALAIARDITFRKREEAALREREGIYRTLFVASPDGILISDAEMREIIYVNPAFGRMLGYAETELKDLSMAALHPSGAWEEVHSQYQALARGERPLLQDLPLRCKDGSVVHDIEVSGSPAVIEGIPCTIAFFRDVTVRRQSEEKLRRSEGLFRATLESTADGIVAMDQRGGITHTNTKFLEMWSVPDPMAKALDDRELFNFMMGQLHDPQKFFAAIQELFVNLRQSFNVLEFKDGRVFEHQSAPMVREGRIEGRVWSFKDITERLRTQRELEAANRKLLELDQMKDNFMSMVSHDLRTPMTGIMAYTQILREKGGELDAESRNKFVGIILKQGERLTRLINDLLDLSKFEAGKMVMEFKELDLVQLAAEAAEAFQAVCNEKKIALERGLAGSGKVMGSRDRLHQVMANLLSNAVKFTPAGGRITVGAVLVNDDGKAGIKVSVADTGPGVPRDQHDRMFEKFHQAGPQAREVGKGSGLGLALVKEIVSAHQGRVGFVSEPGRGSEFYFILPPL